MFSKCSTNGSSVEMNRNCAFCIVPNSQQFQNVPWFILHYLLRVKNETNRSYSHADEWHSISNIKDVRNDECF